MAGAKAESWCESSDVEIQKTLSVLQTTLRKQNCVETMKSVRSSTSLILSNKGLVDISPIQEAHKMRVLLIDGNAIQDITALTSLTELAFLGVADNNISDFRPLQVLPHLDFISLKGNPVQECVSSRVWSKICVAEKEKAWQKKQDGDASPSSPN